MPIEILIMVIVVFVVKILRLTFHPSSPLTPQLD